MNLVHLIILVILLLIYIQNLTTSRQLHYHHPCINHKHLLPKLGPWPFTLVPRTDYPYRAARVLCHFPAWKPPMVSKRPWSLLAHPAHHPPAPSHGSFLLCLECAYHALLWESEWGVISLPADFCPNVSPQRILPWSHSNSGPCFVLIHRTYPSLTLYLFVYWLSPCPSTL